MSMDNSVISLFKDITTLNDITIDTIVNYLVEYGQSDPRFRLGETIKYSPSEIGRILKNKFTVENKFNSLSDQELIKRVKETLEGFTFADEKNEILLKVFIERFEFKMNEEAKRNIGNLQACACACERNESE